MPVTVKVNSSKVTYGEEFIESKYSYESSTVSTGPDGSITVSDIIFPDYTYVIVKSYYKSSHVLHGMT